MSRSATNALREDVSRILADVSKAFPSKPTSAVQIPKASLTDRPDQNLHGCFLRTLGGPQSGGCAEEATAVQVVPGKASRLSSLGLPGLDGGSSQAFSAPELHEVLMSLLDGTNGAKGATGAVPSGSLSPSVGTSLPESQRVSPSSTGWGSEVISRTSSADSLGSLELPALGLGSPMSLPGSPCGQGGAALEHPAQLYSMAPSGVAPDTGDEGAVYSAPSSAPQSLLESSPVPVPMARQPAVVSPGSRPSLHMPPSQPPATGECLVSWVPPATPCAPAASSQEPETGTATVQQGHCRPVSVAQARDTSVHPAQPPAPPPGSVNRSAPLLLPSVVFTTKPTPQPTVAAAVEAGEPHAAGEPVSGKGGAAVSLHAHPRSVKAPGWSCPLPCVSPDSAAGTRVSSSTRQPLTPLGQATTAILCTPSVQRTSIPGSPLHGTASGPSAATEPAKRVQALIVAPVPGHAARLRLSLRHGASLDLVADYVHRLCAHLRERIIADGVPLGGCRGWVPATVGLKECFSMVSDIGKGHFGVVRLCEEVSSRKRFACKTIMKSSIKREVDVDELFCEVLAMLKLQRDSSTSSGAGEHFLRLHEVLEDQDSIHLILDYCNGGDLFEKIAAAKRLSEPEAAHVLKQLLLAVGHMHSMGLLHRDLKPENILLEYSKLNVRGMPIVRVADFGLCVALQKGQMAKGLAGSPFYMAPEVVLRLPYAHKADVWSLGALLYTALSGSLPFWAKDHQGVFQKVIAARPDLQRKPWPTVSQDAKALVKSMLNPDPDRRPSVKELLQHPWLLRHCPELRMQSKAATRLSSFQGKLPEATQKSTSSF